MRTGARSRRTTRRSSFASDGPPARSCRHHVSASQILPHGDRRVDNPSPSTALSQPPLTLTEPVRRLRKAAPRVGRGDGEGQPLTGNRRVRGTAREHRVRARGPTRAGVPSEPPGPPALARRGAPASSPSRSSLYASSSPPTREGHPGRGCARSIGSSGSGRPECGPAGGKRWSSSRHTVYDGGADASARTGPRSRVVPEAVLAIMPRSPLCGR
jgi:hypothetical protein